MLCRLRCLLREWFPFDWLQAIFVGLLLSLPSERALSDYYYALLFFPFLIALHRDDWGRLASSWVLRCCLLLLAVSWVATFQSAGLSGTEIAHIGRRALAAFVFAAMTAWLVDRDRGQILKLCWGLAWGAGVSAVVSLFYFHPRPPYDLRLAGWMWSNSNTGGAVFGLATVAAAAAALASGARAWRIAYALVAILLFACTLLTQSRAATAGVVAAGVACVAATFGRRAIAALVGVAVIVAVALLVSQGDWLARGDAGRFELWSHFWQQAWQRPLLGYGVPQGLAIKIRTGLLTDDPHDMFLYVFLRSGLAGTLCLIALVALIFRESIFHGRGCRDFVPLAFAIYLLMRGLFESVPPTEGPDWFWTYLWIPVGIAAGLELGRRRQAGHGPACA